MGAKQYEHFFLENIALPIGYKSKGTPVPPTQFPSRDRISHAQRLSRQFDAIWQAENGFKNDRKVHSIRSRTGSYIEFTSSENFELLTKSLENLPQGIRLLNIREMDNKTKATVFVPAGKENVFLKKIKEYETENTKKDNPRHAELITSINDIRIALLEALWTDPPSLIPTDSQKVWIEVWLKTSPDEPIQKKEIASFIELLQSLDIEHKNNYLSFPERAVVLINANREQLVHIMDTSDMLAEFRICQEPAGFWVNESNRDQAAWVESILRRLHIGTSNLRVCILDSGVNNGHQLLQPFLDSDNCSSVDPAWGTDDHESGSGHGTLMAGVIAYGDLEKTLLSDGNITISHKLCSVKILPRTGSNKKELYGDITRQAISRAEIQNPDLFILFCMAVTTSEDIDKGRPSSWSGAIDELAYGEGKKQRLIFISAGNINEQEWKNYPNSNFVSSIKNPAQSWNALTVGAYTEKTIINDPQFQGSQPIAPPGGLSPFSTTSKVWQRKWPIKPEIVFEGGNLLKDSSGHLYDHEDLCILSTSRNIQTRQFDAFNATSAATAQASWFASQLALRYPKAWPETIRGLIVHSASWNDEMVRQAGNGLRYRTDIQNLMRVFGYGKPDLDKALNSSENAFTIILQETIQPFEKIGGSSPKMKDMHFYSLPWPKDLLLALADVHVRLRITLSYFIEPGSGEIGWKDKYRYQSFGLRFDLNKETEDEETFKKRINIAVREEDEDIESGSGSDRWKFGDKNRRTGSLHSDIWEGTAAQMASCNKIAVFPIIGWWRERHNLKKYNTKTRYSLIVSLETPPVKQDIYMQVTALLKVPIEIPTRMIDKG